MSELWSSKTEESLDPTTCDGGAVQAPAMNHGDNGTTDGPTRVCRVYRNARRSQAFRSAGVDIVSRAPCCAQVLAVRLFTRANRARAPTGKVRLGRDCCVRDSPFGGAPSPGSVKVVSAVPSQLDFPIFQTAYD